MNLRKKMFQTKILQHCQHRLPGLDQVFNSVPENYADEGGMAGLLARQPQYSIN